MYLLLLFLIHPSSGRKYSHNRTLLVSSVHWRTELFKLWWLYLPSSKEWTWNIHLNYRGKISVCKESCPQVTRIRPQWSFSSPEPTILLACGRDRELWPDPIFWVCAEYSFRILNQSALTGSPWIADFRLDQARTLDPCHRPEGVVGCSVVFIFDFARKHAHPLLLRISSAHSIHDVARATSCISSSRTESKFKI